VPTGPWGPATEFKVDGTAPEDYLPGAPSATVGREFARSRVPNKSGDRHYNETLAVAEAAVSGRQLAEFMQRSTAAWEPAYHEMIERIRKEAYEFKSFADFEPGDLSKRLVFLRFDVHRNDIADAYRLMNANLRLRVPAMYEITWEVDPQDHAYARDYVNLRKMLDPSGFIRFGLHANPLRTWLCVNKFNANGNAMFEFIRSASASSEIAALNESGSSPTLGSQAEIVRGAESYLPFVARRFKRYFPEATTMSSHGDLSLWDYVSRYDPASGIDSRDLAILPFFMDQRRIYNAGFTYNHTSTGTSSRTAYIFDLIRNNALISEKLASLHAAMKTGNAVFLYIHPSALGR